MSTLFSFYKKYIKSKQEASISFSFSTKQKYLVLDFIYKQMMHIKWQHMLYRR